MDYALWYTYDGDSLQLPTEADVAGRSYGNLADLAVARRSLGTFDSAIPQGWVDDVREKLGVYPTCIVWSYPSASVFGLPFPLTAEARDLITKYKEAVRG